MSFRLVRKSVTLNDLDRVMAVILCYFSKLGSFGRALRKVVEDIPKLSATEM